MRFTGEMLANEPLHPILWRGALRRPLGRVNADVMALTEELNEVPKAGFIPNKLRPWIEARDRYRLSHAQVQMARELGLNPKKLGGMANHGQEPWKMPLPAFIKHLYQKRFGKGAPDDVRSIERRVKEKRTRKEMSKHASTVTGKDEA